MTWKERIYEALRSNHVPARTVQEAMLQVTDLLIEEIDRRMPKKSAPFFCCDCKHVISRVTGDADPSDPALQTQPDLRCDLKRDFVTALFVRCRDERSAEAAAGYLVAHNGREPPYPHCGPEAMNFER